MAAIERAGTVLSSIRERTISGESIDRASKNGQTDAECSITTTFDALSRL